MSAIDIIRNGRCQSDLDGDGYKLVNFDTSNLIFGQFGTEPANTIFAGPVSGADDIPSFRLVTADEVGAQPHSAGLDLLSPETPTDVGIEFLTLPNPAQAGYPKIVDLDFIGSSIFVLSPTELRTDIAAQPLSSTLTQLAGHTPTVTGVSFLTLADDFVAGYPKLLGDLEQTIVRLTPAQVVADLGIVGAPFVDSTAIIRGSANNLKLFRIEVDQLSTGTRVMTPPDYDFTPASIDGGIGSVVESLMNKNVNGLTLAAGSAPDEVTAPDYNQSPVLPFQLSIVGIGIADSIGANFIFRSTVPVDVVFPPTGTLATVDQIGGGGGNGSTGRSADLPISDGGTSDLVPGVTFVQWSQRVTLAAGIIGYLRNLTIDTATAAPGAIYRIRLEFDATVNPTVEIYSNIVSGTPLESVSGQEDAATVFLFEAIFDGAQWQKYDGRYVS